MVEQSKGKGDYNIFNIIFKMLNNRGIVPKLDALTGERTAMAADPEWLNDYIQRNGPYLYHSTNSEEQANNIMQNGLLPWDHPSNPSGARLNGGMRPRPNHVYTCVLKVPSRECYNSIRVDLRQLNPHNLNPDEDNMVGNHSMGVYEYPSLDYDQYPSGGDWAKC